jgi:spore maturation protein CgeB
MKKYKILLISELDKPLWNEGWYYKEGLELNGHEVFPFDPMDVHEPVEKIYKILEEFKPDFILHTKDELPAEVFGELRQVIKVIQWYPDPVIPDWLPPYVKASDVFITMSEGLVNEFKRYNNKSFFLTQAFAPSFFQIRKITDRDVNTYSTEVTFVGNLGSKPCYLPRREFLKAVIKNGFKLKWWGPRLPRKISTIPLIIGKLGRAYGGKFVWGEEHAKICKLSKIYLGFDAQPHVRKSMSERLYIAVGCGAFYMCQYIDGIEDVLETDKEIVTFKSEQEMIDKIRYYLKHDDLRKKIAEAGKQRVLKEHTYEVRMKDLIKIIEDNI